MVSRRSFVKGVIGLAAAGTFAAGYASVIDRIIKPTYTPIKPDPSIDEGAKVVYSSCLGCNVRCGIRAKVVERDGVSVVERIEGNPYHPYNRVVDPSSQYTRLDPLPYNTPARESLRYVGTLCARGQDGIHYLYDPYLSMALVLPVMVMVPYTLPIRPLPHKISSEEGWSKRKREVEGYKLGAADQRGC